MSELERKYKVTIFQEFDDPSDVLHGEVYRAGESEILAVVHGRSQLPISFDALKAGDTRVGELTSKPGLIDVTIFDRGEGLGAFQAGLAGAGGLGRPQGLFGAQLGEAFSEPADIFRRSVGGMTDALEGLVKSADSDFLELEAIGVWLALTLGEGDPALDTIYVPRIKGTTV